MSNSRAACASLGDIQYFHTGCVSASLFTVVPFPPSAATFAPRCAVARRKPNPNKNTTVPLALILVRRDATAGNRKALPSRQSQTAYNLCMRFQTTRTPTTPSVPNAAQSGASWRARTPTFAARVLSAILLSLALICPTLQATLEPVAAPAPIPQIQPEPEIQPAPASPSGTRIIFSWGDTTINRLYDPRLGRFLERDPRGYPNGPNPYIFCVNNPVNYLDPLGLETPGESTLPPVPNPNPDVTPLLVPALRVIRAVQSHVASKSAQAVRATVSVIASPIISDSARAKSGKDITRGLRMIKSAARDNAPGISLLDKPSSAYSSIAEGSEFITDVMRQNQEFEWNNAGKVPGLGQDAFTATALFYKVTPDWENGVDKWTEGNSLQGSFIEGDIGGMVLSLTKDSIRTAPRTASDLVNGEGVVLVADASSSFFRMGKGTSEVIDNNENFLALQSLEKVAADVNTAGQFTLLATTLNPGAGGATKAIQTTLETSVPEASRPLTVFAPRAAVNVAESQRLAIARSQLKIVRGAVRDPAVTFQGIVDRASTKLSANPGMARQNLLSFDEYISGQTPQMFGVNYGKAMERLVANDIRRSPIYDMMFEHAGGPNMPDFLGRGIWKNRIFDVTTGEPETIFKHMIRPYGPDLEFGIYFRPAGLKQFP